LTGLAAAAVIAATLSGCGSGDSTVAKTPQATTARATTAPRAPGPPVASGAPTSSSAAPDPCAVNLAAPAIARGVSELPRDPRSQQPWNPEPLAGNYNECAQLSAVIVKANTNAESPNTRAVMFHLGKLIPPQGVPDTYGFNGIDTSQCTGDTVALTYSGGIGLPSVVKFRWNGNGVELIANAGG
jgi:LppP/LprE lipoprotein